MEFKCDFRSTINNKKHILTDKKNLFIFALLLKLINYQYKGIYEKHKCNQKTKVMPFKKQNIEDFYISC